MPTRDERIETYYHNGTRELAEWLVDTEDKLAEAAEVARGEAYDADKLVEALQRIRDLIRAEGPRTPLLVETIAAIAEEAGAV